MTYSQTKNEPSNNWLKINLGSVHCVGKVIVFEVTGSIAHSWTCYPSQCTCGGADCGDYNLDASTETDKSEVQLMCPTVSSCKYLDTVKYEREDGGQMGAFEIAIVGKSGKKFVFI